jgi:cobalt/nickel transport system permease protein
MILPLWAVHISDGVLGWPWLLLGFVVAGLLAAQAAWRLPPEEVPRIALIAAAFFVASSIHVKVGPTSVHLLLTGLVGVILGRRAPLAILIGITLQAYLLGHGGPSTIGVNATTEAIPALLCGLLFPLVRDVQSSLVRRMLVGLGTLLVGVCLAAAAAMLWTTPWGELFRLGSRTPELAPFSLEPMRHPVTLGLLALAVAISLCFNVPPRFTAGALAGIVGVVGTLMLTGGVLLLDGAEKWSVFVSGVLLAHLPLAVLEGVIVGSTVRFLARVKPEMIGLNPAASA